MDTILDKDTKWYWKCSVCGHLDEYPNSIIHRWKEHGN